MTHVIGRGRYARAVYPIFRALGGVGAALRFGFDSSTDDITYPVDAETAAPIKRDSDNPLDVPLPGFASGNVLLIAYTLTLFDTMPSGGTSFAANFQPKVTIDGVDYYILIDSPFIEGFFETTTFIAGVALDLAPSMNVHVGINEINEGPDPFGIHQGNANLVAAEVPTTAVTQFPLLTLTPVPP